LAGRETRCQRFRRPRRAPTGASAAVLIAGFRNDNDLRDTRFVKNNGCTAMNPPEPANNTGTHICTSYDGCTAGHPVRWCAFDGSNGHDPSPKDPGQSMTWNPAEAWKFFTQF
jgi:hypothetical protein